MRCVSQRHRVDVVFSPFSGGSVSTISWNLSTILSLKIRIFGLPLVIIIRRDTRLVFCSVKCRWIDVMILCFTNDSTTYLVGQFFLRSDFSVICSLRFSSILLRIILVAVSPCSWRTNYKFLTTSLRFARVRMFHAALFAGSRRHGCWSDETCSRKWFLDSIRWNSIIDILFDHWSALVRGLALCYLEVGLPDRESSMFPETDHRFSLGKLFTV